MTDPHTTYYDAIMTTLGDEADPDESFAEFNSDNGEVMLAEIVIFLDRKRCHAAGWDSSLVIRWDQVAGWQWFRDGSSNIAPLLYALVATPDSIAAAVHRLLDADGDGLPLLGQDTEPVDPVSLTGGPLARAIDEGDIEQDTGLRLARYLQAAE